jgi:hypothetical protein
MFGISGTASAFEEEGMSLLDFCLPLAGCLDESLASFAVLSLLR